MSKRTKKRKLRLENVGQIVQADISFGDLTILVGAQATGKSIALQCLKLVVDIGHVQHELKRYGIDWSGELPEFMDAYFGEGMRSIWIPDSRLTWDGKEFDPKARTARMQRDKKESLFFIPAQRVLALRDGWPRNFSDYSAGDPFAVREYSERLRNLVEQEFGGAEQLFPQERRLKSELRQLLQEHVFSQFTLQVDKVMSQKRMVLGSDEHPLPYMVWSAGQREFVPLLLGFYWLVPPAKVSRRGDIEWVVIEEIEMGLHPRAISVTLLLVLELLSRGYRVCLSTHSPQVLEAVWAIQHLKENGGDAVDLLNVFDAPNTQSMRRMALAAMEKTVSIYYFERETGKTREISDLDAESEEEGQAGWGGLLEFSGRANSAVAHAVANAR